MNFISACLPVAGAKMKSEGSDRACSVANNWCFKGCQVDDKESSSQGTPCYAGEILEELLDDAEPPMGAAEEALNVAIAPTPDSEEGFCSAVTSKSQFASCICATLYLTCR